LVLGYGDARHHAPVDECRDGDEFHHLLQCLMYRKASRAAKPWARR
jgi:hypothetical protein